MSMTVDENLGTNNTITNSMDYTFSDSNMNKGNKRAKTPLAFDSKHILKWSTNDRVSNPEKQVTELGRAERKTNINHLI